MSWPQNPTNGQQVQINGILYAFNTSNNTWDRLGGFGVNAVTDSIAADNVQAKDLTVTRSADLGSVADITIAGGTSGYVMTTDGAGNLTWAPQATSAAAGIPDQIQYNAAGAFAGSANLTFDPTSNTLSATKIAGNLTTAAQPNITSVGTLVSLNVTGNVDAGNVKATTVTGNLVGNVTGTLSAPGADTRVLINTQGNVGASPNLTFNGTLLSVTGNIGATKVTATTLAGTLATAIQPSITQVGTLTGLTASGDITAPYFVGNVIGGTIKGSLEAPGGAPNDGQITYNNQGTISSSSALTFVNGVLAVTGNLSSGNANLGNLTKSNFFTGVLTAAAAAQPNITSVGTLTSLAVTGNISSGNANLGNLTKSNFFTGVLTSVASAQPNITTVGSLTSLTVIGNITTGNIDTTGSITGVDVTYTTLNAPATTAANAVIYKNTSGRLVGSASLTYDGSALTATGNIAAGNVNGGNLTKSNFLQGVLTATSSAQPNITSVGPLTGLTVAGDITATTITGSIRGDISGEIVAAGSTNEILLNKEGLVNASSKLSFNDTPEIALLAVIGNIESGNANLGNLAIANYVAGVLTTPGQPNITSTGTLTGLTVDGPIAIRNSSITVDDNTFITGNLVPVTTITYDTDGTTVLNPNTPTYDLGSEQHRWRDLYLSGSTIRMGTVSLTSSTTGLTTNITTIAPDGSASTAPAVISGAQLTSTTTDAGVAPFVVYSSAMVANLNVEFLQGFKPNTANLPNTIALRDQFNNFSANIITANLVGNATTAGTVVTPAQPLITSVGLLTSLDVQNDVTANNISVSYAVEAATIEADGYMLGNVTGANVTGEVKFANVANNVAGAKVSGQVSNALVSGTVYTAAQPTITSVGTLTALEVSNSGTGNIKSDNAALGNVASANYFVGGNFTGNFSGRFTSPGANTHVIFNNDGNIDASAGLTFNVLTNAVSIAGYLTSVDANLGNVVRANYFVGNGVSLSSLTGANVTGEVKFANVANNVVGSKVSGQVANALVSGTVYTAAQPAITSVGTLTSLSVAYPSSTTSVPLTVTQTWNSSAVAFTGIKENITDTASDASSLLIDLQVGSQSKFKVNKVGDTTLANLTAANVAGTITTASQPYITSVGKLSTLEVTGNIDAKANVNVTGNITVTNITATNVSGSGAALTNLPIAISIANGTSNVAVDGSANVRISIAGTANVIVVSKDGAIPVANVNGNLFAGNVNGGNLVKANFLEGNGIGITNIAGVNVTGTVASATTATTAGTVTTAAQTAITSVGSLTGLTVSGDVGVTGNATITGNLTVTGTTITANVTTIVVKDPIIELGGNVAVGGVLTTNDLKDRGTILHYYDGAAKDAFMGWDNNAGEFAFGSNVSVASDVVTFNTLGNVRAGYFIGDGSQLTNIPGGSQIASTGGSNVIAALTGNVNISAGSTANVLVVTGTGANIVGYANITGTVTANRLVSTVATGTAPFTVTSTTQVANLAVEKAGTVTTAAQPAITSVGTLTALSVTGAVTASTLTSTVATGTAPFTVTSTTPVTNLAATTAATVTSAAQAAITSVGSLIGLTVAGNAIFSGGYTSVKSLLEAATITAGAPTATTVFDVLTQGVQYYTSATTNAFILNVKGNSTATLNSVLTLNQSVSIGLLVNCSATTHYMSAVAIDGATITPKWQGGTAPTAGSGSGAVDVYTLTIIKTGASAYTVLASTTKFA